MKQDAALADDDLLSKVVLSEDETDYTAEVRELMPADMKPQYTMTTERLVRRFGPKPENIRSYGAFIQAAPGEITAIMGPSGAGKTVLLKMLCGYDQPSAVLTSSGGMDSAMVKNAIQICGLSGEAGLSRLGYVPQGDVMYPELTTEESLRYRMQLRFGNLLTESDIQQCITHSCLELLRLDGTEVVITKDSTVKKKIGQMDWQGAYPSGGQRRRINIAHELVLEPSVLVLDEPTSGLSSKDSEDLMEALFRLAKAKQLCIIMTIHQPSDNMFRKIDDLLLLVRGGRLAYYGKRALALSWIQENLKEALGKEKLDKAMCSANEAEAIMNLVDTKEGGQILPSSFNGFLLKQGRNLEKCTILT